MAALPDLQARLPNSGFHGRRSNRKSGAWDQQVRAETPNLLIDTISLSSSGLLPSDSALNGGLADTFCCTFRNQAYIWVARDSSAEPPKTPDSSKFLKIKEMLTVTIFVPGRRVIGRQRRPDVVNAVACNPPCGSSWKKWQPFINSRISSGASSGVVNHVPPYECVTLSESYADEVMDKAKRNAE